jgi:hypothetical protein
VVSFRGIIEYLNQVSTERPNSWDNLSETQQRDGVLEYGKRRERDQASTL